MGRKIRGNYHLWSGDNNSEIDIYKVFHRMSGTIKKKRNEIMLFAAMWMYLEVIKLGEVRKSKTNTV